MKKSTIALIGVLMVLILSVTMTGHASGLFDYFNQDRQETVTITKAEYDSLKKYQKLDEILAYIEEYYYQEPDVDAMLEMAARGLMAGLEDPYTFYYNPQEWSDMWADDEGEYGGIGIQLLGNYEDNTVFITRVFKDTPAERAGLLRGDKLIRVEDILVDATTMQNAVNLMRGELESEVEVEVLRGGEPLVFMIPRATIHVNRVESMMLEDQVGYICLYEFAGDCAAAFEKALDGLIEQGATSLVIDLRDNGGGWVDDAVSVADLFLDEQLLFYSEDRYGNREESRTKDGKTDIPLVLLVNEFSASSSEILSGSLRDLGRATLVGTNTYGKGIIQYVVPLSEGGDGIQFTVAQYFLASGEAVHTIGVMPDVVVELPEDMTGVYMQFGDMSDPQLKTAWEYAKEAAATAE